MKKKRISNQEYHVRNMRHLIKDAKKLLNIANFPRKYFYQREDEKGWWMPMKQFAIKSYCNLYLRILQRHEYIDTFFIDPLSSNGMVKLTKNKKNDVLIMPGISLNAALISLKKDRGFSKFFINDIDPDNREIINKRFEALNQVNNNALKFNIEAKDKGKIDSNNWIIDVLHNIKNEYDRPNYLMIIDNQGMDIKYETIKNIRNLHGWGDIIITFHDTAFSRAIHSEKAQLFFGKKINKDFTTNQRRKTYIDQLKSIGFGRIEELFIRSHLNFFYTLLFCCRDDISADWLNMIKDFRNSRFKYCNDQFMKHIYDIAHERTRTIDQFIN